MAKIAHLTGCSSWIDLEFVERERTPPRLMKPVFDYIWRNYRFRIPSPNLRNPMSNAVGKRSTIGCRKPIYSPQTAKVRIRLR